MTITIHVTEEDNAVEVSIETAGLPDASPRQRLFALGLLEGMKAAIPLTCKLLNCPSYTCIERDKHTTTE